MLVDGACIESHTDGSLPAGGDATLLRMLEYEEIRRLGASRPSYIVLALESGRAGCVTVLPFVRGRNGTAVEESFVALAFSSSL